MMPRRDDSFHGAHAVHAEIERLALAERFDAVLLASCLINHPDPLQRSVESVRRSGNNVSMTLHYALYDDVWLHSFTVTALSELEVEQCLSEFGFGTFAWYGSGRRWVHAKVAGAS